MRDRLSNELLTELRTAIRGNSEAVKVYEKLRKRLNKLDELLAMHDEQCEKRFTIAMSIGNAARATQEASLVYEYELRMKLLSQSLPGMQIDDNSARLQEAIEMGREVVTE